MIPPSVTLSARFFITIGVTDVIGSTPSTLTSDELRDKRQDRVQFPAQMLDLPVRDRDPGEMGNPANGRRVDRHECTP